jgi:hypothetical protein
MRRNTDEEIRRLERLAAEGDAVAQAKLDAMRTRLEIEVFLDWDDLVEELDLTKSLIYQDDTPDWIQHQADQDASAWIDEYQEDRRGYLGEQDVEGEEDFSLSEEQAQAIRDLFYYAVEHEWLPKTRLEGRIDEIVDPINEWAERGPQSEGITEHAMPSGHAVDWRIVEGTSFENSGVAFRLYPPFLTALAEAEYCVYGGTDERELHQITGKDVIRVYRWIKTCEGERLIDISGDTDNYTPPREREILKAIRTLDDLKWTSWPASEKKVVVKVARQRGWIRHDEPDLAIGTSLAKDLAWVFEGNLQPTLTAQEKKIGQKIVKRIGGLKT